MQFVIVGVCVPVCFTRLKLEGTKLQVNRWLAILVTPHKQQQTLTTNTSENKHICIPLIYKRQTWYFPCRYFQTMYIFNRRDRIFQIMCVCLIRCYTTINYKQQSSQEIKIENNAVSRASKHANFPFQLSFSFHCTNPSLVMRLFVVCDVVCVHACVHLSICSVWCGVCACVRAFVAV